MTYILRIEQPLLKRWLTSDATRQKVFLIDLEPDLNAINELHLDLTVNIKRCRIKRRNIGLYGDYSVGCTSAVIKFEARDGLIRGYSPDRTLNVDYNNSSTRRRKFAFKLTPDISYTASGGVEAKAKAVEIGFEAENESTFSAAYQGEERFLKAEGYHDFVEWEIMLPRGEKAVSDFLWADLHLFVDSYWDNLPAKGTISVEATKLCFFDPDRRPINFPASLAMEIVLWKRGISLRDKDIKCDFVFNKDE